MKIFHDEGNNFESAFDMKAAILSSGGVPAVNVAVSGPPDDLEYHKIWIKVVSPFANVFEVFEAAHVALRFSLPLWQLVDCIF